MRAFLLHKLRLFMLRLAEHRLRNVALMIDFARRDGDTNTLRYCQQKQKQLVSERSRLKNAIRRQ